MSNVAEERASRPSWACAVTCIPEGDQSTRADVRTIECMPGQAQLREEMLGTFWSHCTTPKILCACCKNTINKRYM